MTRYNRSQPFVTPQGVEQDKLLIKKGESYYWVKFKYQPKRVKTTPFTSKEYIKKVVASGFTPNRNIPTVLGESVQETHPFSETDMFGLLDLLQNTSPLMFEVVTRKYISELKDTKILYYE